MKLFEISQEVSKNQFLSIVNSLVVELHNISMSLEKMTDDGHGDILRRHMASRTARWFSTNFPTLLSAANSLKSLDSSFKGIAHIGVSSFTSSSGKTELTKSSGYETFMHYAQIALKKLDRPGTAAKLQQAYDKCMSLVEAGRVEQAQSATFNKERKVKDDLKGKQNNAVEQMINTVIKGLDPSLQHAARLAVTKSDNKLQALQSFLDANKNGA